jgi:hypothetical protein
MELNFALQLSSKHLNLESTKTLCVTSDGGVFINNPIDFMEAYAKERNLKIFVFKNDADILKKEEVVEINEVTKVKTEEPKKTKKK